MRKILTILFILLGLSVSATHLVGGNMAYTYLGDTDGDGDFNYKITFQTFLDCNSIYWDDGFPENTLEIGVYEGVAVPTGNLIIRDFLTLRLVDSSSIAPEPTKGCNIGQTVCLYQATYEAVVDLPLSFAGYHLFYDRCCRTGTVVNLNNSGDQGLAFHAFIPPTLVNNNSPVFSDVPVLFLCVGDTTSILNTATDSDGDLLIFSFVNPYKGFGTPLEPTPNLPQYLTWPIPNVNWVNTTFDENNPFGRTGHAFMNGATGLTEYMAPNLGNYVVAVEIREFRFGNLIGITRRDMQFMAINCPPNLAPSSSLSTSGGTTSYTVQECDNLTFPIIFSDQDGDSLFLSNTGDLFNSSIVNPNANIDELVQGDSIVIATFNWHTGCGAAQPLPYFFTASASDNGCPSKTTNIVYEINVEPTSAPDSIVGSPLVCENTITTYSTDTINGYTFNWSVTGGTIISGQGSTSININWGGVGGGEVSVLGVSSCGCPSVAIDTNITILVLPSVDAGLDLTICAGDNVQIGGVPTGPEGSSISWSPNTDITDSSVGNPFVFPPSTKDYMVTVGNGACLNSDTLTIFVNPLPIVDAGVDQAFCTTTTVILGGSPTAPAGTTFSWNPSAPLNNDTLANPTATVNTTTSFIVAVTNSNTCIGIDSVLIAINPPTIQPTFTVDTSVCIGHVIDPLPTTSTNGFTGSWSPTLNDTTTTTYTFTPDVGQCAITTTLTITVNPLVTLTFDSVTAICAGDLLNPLPTTSTNGYTGTWSPVLNNMATTTYTFTPDVGQCAITTTLLVTVNAPIAPTFNAISPICIGDFLNPLPTIATNGITGTWSPALNNLVSTTYTFTPTIGTCATTTTTNITVNPLPLVDAGTDVDLCQGASVQLSARGATTYSWTPVTNISNPIVSNPVVSPETTTTYVVVGTDGNMCTNSDSVDVIVFTIPTISDTTICIGDELQLIAKGPLNGTYSWSPASNLSNANIYNPITNTTTTITYVVTVQDVNGCLSSESLLVTAVQKPIVDFSMKAKFDCEGILAEFTNLSTRGISYLWTFGDGEQSTAFNPIHMFKYGANFTTILVASNANSCMNTADSIITTTSLETQFKSKPLSVFSPNNDGINDVFQIDVPEGLAACTKLQIFNRWGLKIFESEGGNVAWDGTTNVKKTPEGTYFYIIEINGITKKGTLTLLE